MTDKVIAIDGPSGSGKSTITKLLADELNFLYLDTGAMFRALAYKLDELGIDFSKNELTADETEQVRAYLENLDFQYAPSSEVLIMINGEDLSQKIREHHVSKMASVTSKFPVVRQYLKKAQREAAKKAPSILEGRDIGTVIFPDAALKFFLTASSDVRAKRRLAQLKEAGKDAGFTLDKIRADIEKRDEEDSKRALAPLKKAEDAIAIDTSTMTIPEVVDLMISEYAKRAALFK